MYDCVIKNGLIVDGTLNPIYKADVGITGDKITAVGDLQNVEAKQSIDAQGLYVAPGFIDIHAHSDAWLLREKHFHPKTAQGFTTELLMLDGIGYAPVSPYTVHEWIFYLRSLNALRLDEYIGWETIAEFTALLEGKTVQNFATHIPYANVRSLVMGFGKAAPDDSQMQMIQSIIRESMAHGAVGVSTGMDYIAQCFASTDELADACSALTEFNGLYVTHIRYRKGILNALKEAVEIGKRARIPVHISHLKSPNPADCEPILKYIDQVAVNEVDFSFDLYPYMPSSTMLSYYLPLEIWKDGALSVMAKLNDPQFRYRFSKYLPFIDLKTMRIAWVQSHDNHRHIGKRLEDYIEETGKNPVDVLCDLLIEERLAVLLVLGQENDVLLEPFLKHPKSMIGSDGIYFPDGQIHPRLAGTVPRFLSRFDLPLEQAIYKLSGCPAKRFGFKERGMIRENYYADVVVFDHAHLTDPTTFENPHALSDSFKHVLINGTPVILSGACVNDTDYPLSGRFLKKEI